MVGIANALVLNIGTLEPDWIDAMEVAGKRQTNSACLSSWTRWVLGRQAAHGIEQASSGECANIDSKRKRGRGGHARGNRVRGEGSRVDSRLRESRGDRQGASRRSTAARSRSPGLWTS